MPRVGEPAREEPAPHPLLQVLADDHRAERDVARVDPLRHGEDVRDDVPVLAGEPPAGTTEARHDLVENQEDPVPVADLADRLQIARRWRDDPVRAGHGLEDHRGDRVRALVLEDLLEVRRARADRARIRVTGRTAVRVRIEHPNDAAHPRLVRPASRVARQDDRAVGRAVVRAVARDDLVPPGREAREPDRVLVRLRARVREERHAQVARRDLLQQATEVRARLRGHRRPDRAEAVRLLLDRRDDLRVLVADVDVDELRREIEITRALVVPEVPAFGPGHRDRVDRVLRGPRVEDVLLRVLDDLGAEIRVGLHGRHHAGS